MTQGSIPFVGASGVLSQDNANLFWDGANHRLGIGFTNPTAALQIKAGTATVAPLMLTQGVNLTTPASGAIEYDGTNLYFTDNTNTRRTLSTSAGASSQSSTTNFTFNSNSDNAGNDGGFNFQSNGSNLMTIDNSGNVGITGNETISGTSTFTTGSGNVALNGATSIAANKNFSNRLAARVSSLKATPALVPQPRLRIQLAQAATF